MRAPPTTFEFIEATAATEPGRLALLEGGREIRYGQFHALLASCMATLHGLGVRPGQRVAVAGPGFVPQLAMLLACEALGAVSASFGAEADVDAPALFELVDWAFAVTPQAVPERVRFHRIEPAFFQAPIASGPDARAAAEPKAPHRIVRTSGSSGRCKFILLSRQAQDEWTRSIESYDKETRLLLTAPLVINAGFGRSTCVLRLGGALLAGRGADLPALNPTHVWGLPLQVGQLLAEAPVGYAAPRIVPVDTVGGTVTPELRATVARVFGSAIISRYGSNEVGAVCDHLDATGAGWLRAGVEVRVLGPAGEDLTLGQSGILAFRAPSMAEGYLGQPPEVAAAFHDGWFTSADIGALLAPRRLRLDGRHDDLINVAGIKVPAAQVEAEVRQLAAVADCAALAVHLEGGAISLGLAIVLAPGATAQQAAAQLREGDALPAGARARIIFVSAMPILPSSKVDRMALLRLFEAPA
jgi:acyl-coenzyme A synthetase/AMP-(fatty) acid ligase